MHMQKTFTWKEFLESARSFIDISEKLGDTWKLIEKSFEEGSSYLTYEQKIKCKFDVPVDQSFENFVENIENEDEASLAHNDELIRIEYHVVYSISYQIPILYFRAYKSDGSMVCLEESWKLFTDATKSIYSKSDMLSILTQMEHPILYKPFLALHPCKTAEILGNSPQSKNFILTFLSVMGPFVQLKLTNDYGVL
ncbi:ubiquitin-like-conjugating enzyme ATG10 [Condylostylus longicornis]|uniref:ubiquitin-like-conjugating enzyme ATG10 n=1 Tax=Condylostylus longicornis TaxID=2530218 RepID=UPI00244DF510|nr:ubiquitin-like-conjugating enzyme ATG10 [Condylostylus longicornis]XP_055379624.1 ubiquitin-like-conjugating enzyme ATG10 [Condylostylus longicornis]